MGEVNGSSFACWVLPLEPEFWKVSSKPEASKGAPINAFGSSEAWGVDGSVCGVR